MVYIWRVHGRKTLILSSWPMAPALSALCKKTLLFGMDVPKKFLPILNSQSWDSWGQNFSQTDKSLAHCNVFSWWNLLLKYLLPSQGDNSLGISLLKFWFWQKLHVLDRYQKKSVIQVSTKKNDINVQYLYNTLGIVRISHKLDHFGWILGNCQFN